MAIEKIVIPDFGDVQKITVVEVFIAEGDTVEEEASLIALESEKAVMDLPSPFAGKITEVLVKEEDVVSSGDVIATVDTGAEAEGETAEERKEGSKAREDQQEVKKQQEEPEQEDRPQDKVEEAGKPRPEEREETAETSAPNKGAAIESASPDKPVPEKKEQPQASEKAGKEKRYEQVVHATPSVRALAREKGVDLATLAGTGPNERILQEDVRAALGSPAGAESRRENLEDFSKYGEIEEMALGRIQKISGPQLHKSWITIPHVTHFEEADITHLEQFRKELNDTVAAEEPSYSPLVFVIKAAAATLRRFPLFNCSMVPGGEKVILKKYYHLNIAVDTPNGLVVPVIRNVDQRGFKDIAAELKRLSSSARAGKLAIQDMQGGSFTISSLGGIGGTGFTPIINGTQVAILGLSRSYMKPVWDGGQFVPRLILPFSVSYDHRIIDGAEAARFCKALRMNIEDLKRVLL